MRAVNELQPQRELKMVQIQNRTWITECYKIRGVAGVQPKLHLMSKDDHLCHVI